MQKSTSLILPLFDIKYNEKIINTYMSCPFFQGNDNMDEYFYIETADKNLKDVYQQNPRYSKTILTPRATFLLALQYTPEQRKGVVKPFIDGRYSQIDRSYVAKSFPVYTSNGTISGNYAILTKSPILKKYWEERIGVTLPEDAEVWSKIKKEDETFVYE